MNRKLFCKTSQSVVCLGLKIEYVFVLRSKLYNTKLIKIKNSRLYNWGIKDISSYLNTFPTNMSMMKLVYQLGTNKNNLTAELQK